MKLPKERSACPLSHLKVQFNADSRRLYYKKKQQKAELSQQIQVLQDHNDKIRADNERLECLLAQARVLIS